MKTSFTNREGNSIVVLVENILGKNGLVFIAHGLAGNKEKPHVQAYANAFLSNDYKVVRWDATNSIGESDGSLFKATLSNYYSDFEDVVSWAEKQDWYQEPFVVVGHSFGSACNILFTFKFPHKVKALAPTSAFLSGSIYLDWLGKDVVDLWKEKGYREEENQSKSDVLNKFHWDLAEDMMKYDLFDMAKNIFVPVFLMVGSHDLGAPLSSQQKFFDLLPTDKKELHIIEGSGHTYRSKKHISEVKKIMTSWAKKQISD